MMCPSDAAGRHRVSGAYGPARSLVSLSCTITSISHFRTLPRCIFLSIRRCLRALASRSLDFMRTDFLFLAIMKGLFLRMYTEKKTIEKTFSVQCLLFYFI